MIFIIGMKVRRYYRKTLAQCLHKEFVDGTVSIITRNFIGIDTGNGIEFVNKNEFKQVSCIGIKTVVMEKYKELLQKINSIIHN